MTTEYNPKSILWSDRKRTWFGVPCFTRYTLTGEKLIVEDGFLHQHLDEVRLYRIRDVGLNRSMRERLLGLGSISIASTDQTMGNFSIERVRDSRQVMNLLSELVEENRRRNYVYARDSLDFDRERM